MRQGRLAVIWAFILVGIFVFVAATSAVAMRALVGAVSIADAKVAATIAVEFARVVTGLAIELSHGRLLAHGE
jgi:hypothetical protein